MKTKLIVYWEPEELGIPEGALKTRKDLINECFRVYTYETESAALWAYANKRCTWSTLLESNQNEMDFMLDACEKIERKNYDWLEEHFV